MKGQMMGIGLSCDQFVSKDKYISRKLIIGTMAILLGLGHFSRAMSDEPADIALKQAWGELPVPAQDETNIKDKQALLLLKTTSDVDELLLEKIINYSPSPAVPGSGDDFSRIRGAIRANGAMGCIWLVTAHRRLNEHALVEAIVMAPSEMMAYQEYVQFLVGLLFNPNGNFDEVSSLEPLPMRTVYRGRVCDRSYNVLVRYFKTVPEARQVAEQIGWKNAFEPYTRYMPHEERDTCIQQLIKVLTTPEVLALIQSGPSALEELERAGVWNPITDCAAVWLSRIEPKIMSRKMLPESPVGLHDALLKEYPIWSDSDKQYVEMLQDPKYSARDIVVRLPQAIPRNRGDVELALLRRDDRAEVIGTLIDFFSAEESRHVHMSILDLLGELTQGATDESKGDVSAFLKSVAESPEQTWFLKQSAENALKRINEQVPKG